MFPWKSECESKRHSVMSDSLRHHGLYSVWNSPGKNTEVGSLSIFQGIFPTQGSNPGLPHCRKILNQLSYQGSTWKQTKHVLFLIGDWNAKGGSQEIHGVTGNFGLGVQNEASQKLTELCQGNALVIEDIFFRKHKGWFYTWTSPDGQHQNQVDCIIWSWRWKSSIQLAKQDGKLTVAQIMNSLLPNSDLH